MQLLLWLTLCLAEEDINWVWPRNRDWPDVANSAFTAANRIASLLYADLDVISAPLFTTSREIGYCPAAHLDIFSFGQSRTTAGGPLMSAVNYNLMPDVLTARLTGYWYSSVPVNVNADVGDGYCPVFIEGWTDPTRYTSAEVAMLSDHGAYPGGPIGGLTLTVLDWYNMLTDGGTKEPPTLRTIGEDGSPVVKLLILQDRYLPVFSDSGKAICSDTYCLRHKDLHYKVEKAWENGAECMRVSSARHDRAASEYALNKHVCGAIKEYKRLLSHMNDTVSLYALSEKRKQEALSSLRMVEGLLARNSSDMIGEFIEDVETVLATLQESGYSVSAGEGSEHCPYPSTFPSREQFRKVLNYIKPDYVFLLYGNDISGQDEQWTSDVRAFMTLFDGIVPVEHRVVAKDEGGLMTVSEWLPTALCDREKGGPVGPTLTPDEQPHCDIAGERFMITPGKPPSFLEACKRLKWRIIYSAVLSGSTGGAVIAIGGYYLANGIQSDLPDLDDQLEPNKDVNEDTTDAVLFAH